MIIRFAALAAVPWKNGGGVTREYAVHPEGAGLDDFEWRVSSAEIRQDGPFSRFEGIDRALVVLEGDGVELRFPDRLILLSPASDPLDFPGDSPVTARLTGGPVRDLNVMTRRASWRAEVRRTTLCSGQRAEMRGEANLFVAERACAVRIDGRPERLERGDAVLGLVDAQPFALDQPSPAPFLAIALCDHAPRSR